MSKKIVLIDGHSIINRAFYGVPDLTNSEGLHTNAVLGFLNIMFRILDEETPEYLMVAFDVKAPTFRHIQYEQYKGTRKPMPEELHEQVPVLKEVLSAMHIQVVEKGGYEADDILGTIAKNSSKEGFEAVIVSGDRDLLQLAEERIKIRIPKTKRGGTEIEDYYAADVKEAYGVTPFEFIDIKGLMGDPSDNIPGVPGIGEKTAAKIIIEFGSIENAYNHIDEVNPKKARESLRDNYDLAVLSKELATIKLDCELDFKLEDAIIEDLYNEQVFAVLRRLEFKSLIARFQKYMEHNGKEEDFNFKRITMLQEAESIFTSIKEQASKCQTDPSKIKYHNVEDIPYAIPDTGINYEKAKERLEKAVGYHIGAALIKENETVLGLALSYEKDAACFIEAGSFVTVEFLTDRLQSLLSDNIAISVIDLKGHLPYLEAKETDALYDMSVAAYLLNPIKDSYHYDDISRDYLSSTVPDRMELLGKVSLQSAMEEKEEAFLKYCCYQALTASEALSEIASKLDENHMLALYLTVEMPLVYTLSEMEERGIRVNKDELKNYGDKLYVRIVELEKTIYELVGEEFNINSPKQLGVILFEKLKLPFAKKTKTGYSTSADILDKLKCEDPVIPMILEYRQLTKLKSTYADGLANYINPEDQRIHGSFNQTITATGRISSTEPNLQNIPIRMELGREIRKVFIPEEEYVFLDADYSQIELRVLAHMSGDDMLIKAYQQEQDIHKITASQVFHTPLDEVTGAQRSNAKAVNFGIVYGISSFGLGQDLNITKKEAETYIKKYFETYPSVKNFLDGLVNYGKEHGYVTSLFGRKRPIMELSSSNFMQRSFGERIAMNSPIQGTAADIIKIAMIRVNLKLKEMGLHSRLILQIHDELLIETYKDEIDVVRKILSENMHDSAQMTVPLEVDVNMGQSWYDSK